MRRHPARRGVVAGQQDLQPSPPLQPTQGTEGAHADGAAQGSSDIARARAMFPRGLAQPEGGFRASVDALLLAEFAQETCPQQPFIFAELGVGNGMAACALALGVPHARGFGVDNYAPAVAAAEVNIRLLGLEQRLYAVHGDVSAADFMDRLQQSLCSAQAPSGAEHGHGGATHVSGGASQNFVTANMATPAGTTQQAGDISLSSSLLLARKRFVPPLSCGAAGLAGQAALVIANPPYRAAGAGRCSRAAGREQALVEREETLPSFCRAAAQLLAHGGRFCCIYAASRLPYLLRCLGEQHFGIRRLCVVHTKTAGAAGAAGIRATAGGARFVLAEGRLYCADDVFVYSKYI